MSEGRVSEESLGQLLARVHERLRQAGSVDAESRKLLTALVSDIDRALARGSAPHAAGSHAPGLESLAVRFEADHPALAEVIRDVIDALVRVGI
ncbi:MAG: DUF4404 family protein [Steroidobacteraceae bacterium]